MSDTAFRVLLNLLQNEDASQVLLASERGALTEILEAEAKRRGYRGWTDAWDQVIDPWFENLAR